MAVKFSLITCIWMHTHTVSSPLDVRGAGTFIGSLLSVTANPFSHRFFGQQVTELPPIIAWLLLCHKYNSEGLPFLGPSLLSSNGLTTSLL